MFCYLWTKKNGQPYIDIVKGMALEHPQLLQENRKRMKILLIDPNEDLPEQTLRQILVSAKALYRLCLINRSVSFRNHAR